MDNRTILISFGLFFDLVGGILLASEMIGLLERIKNYNLYIRNKIMRTESILLSAGFALGVLGLAMTILKFKITITISQLKDIATLIILVVIYRVNHSMLSFLERLTKKLGAERVLGFIGVFFLCVGFIFQAIVNFMTV